MAKPVILPETDPPKKRGQFVKGDPRINRKGRPRNFDALRELAQHIAHEKVKGTAWSRVELILRHWASSDKAELQRAFIDIAYGKVKDELELSGALDVTSKIIRVRDVVSDAN